MVVQYKCPSCGADMAFDSKSGKLICDSCGRQETIDTMHKENVTYKDTNPARGTISNNENIFNQSRKNEHYFKENEATEYHCNNCGASLITDANTSATTCTFCGAGVVLSDRLAGHLSPNLVIPFKISKEEAKQAFKKWCKKGLLTPKDFMTADRITSITGLYVPFWLYDLACDGEANATCTKVRRYESGDYIITETKHYNVYRKVKLQYDLVPCDASEKMDDVLMEKLEPFHYQDLKEFQMPYLAGFIAEKYSYDDKTLFGRMKQRVGKYVESYIRSTITGYSTTHYNHQNITVTPKSTHYTLMPVWVVCYDYKKAEHIFAMNGQTGKIVGRPPLSGGKITLMFFGLSTAFFAIMQIITFISKFM